MKVALVGAGAVGKTTLLHHLVALEQSKPAQTIEPELTLFHVEEPVKLLVYLDASGQELTQQFEIIDHADFLLLLLDHNEADNRSVSRSRRQLQASNVDNLVRKIRRRQRALNPLVAIHLLRNKKDLWQQCPTNQADGLAKWFAEQTQKVRATMPNDTVSEDEHTNANAEDIARVRKKVMELARLVVQRRTARP